MSNKLTYPEPPLGRMLNEDIPGTKVCEICGSNTIKRYYFFGKIKGCIQPKCKNYYKGGKSYELLQNNKQRRKS